MQAAQLTPSDLLNFGPRPSLLVTGIVVFLGFWFFFNYGFAIREKQQQPNDSESPFLHTFRIMTTNSYAVAVRIVGVLGAIFASFHIEGLYQGVWELFIELNPIVWFDVAFVASVLADAPIGTAVVIAATAAVGIYLAKGVVSDVAS